MLVESKFLPDSLWSWLLLTSEGGLRVIDVWVWFGVVVVSRFDELDYITDGQRSIVLCRVYC